MFIAVVWAIDRPGAVPDHAVCISGEDSMRGRQIEMFPCSMQSLVAIDPKHPLIVLTHSVDFTALIEQVQKIRRRKLKSKAGRPPHLRALVGALLFKATRDMTWRDAEDQIKHYVPARYLCGLMDSKWSPDHTTLHDFAVLLGEEGVALINAYVVDVAVQKRLADKTVIVADTTAQQAAIGHPNEMGLLASFLAKVLCAARRAGRPLVAFAKRAKTALKNARRKLLRYRLRAKQLSKTQKNRATETMAKLVGGINRHLGTALSASQHRTFALRKYGKVARQKLEQLHRTMRRLLPQVRHWLRTGFVAPGKIISLQIPELYAIVRGKVGKAVEFGCNWGLTQLKGGFVIARRAKNRKELVDAKFVVAAVKDHRAHFGRAPRAFAYDRGGYSARNVTALKKLGVKHVGIKPRGKSPSPVCHAMRRRLAKLRARIEGSIGAAKSARYNFDRPRAHSVQMMGFAGQLAFLGLNLNKLIRGLAA